MSRFINIISIFLKKYKKITSLVFSGVIDVTTPEGRAKDRERRIALTALAAAFSRLISMAIPLITISITLNYLGKEIYGLWMAVTAFFVLFRFSDFGLGSGLQTELSKMSGLDNPKACKRLISNAFIMLSAFTMVIFLIFFIFYKVVDWGQLFNATSNQTVNLASSVVFAVVIPKILNIPLAIVQRTQLALQEGFQSYLWQSAGSVLSLLSVYVITFFDLGPISMVWGSSMIVVVIALLNMFVFFTFQRPDLRPSFKDFDKNLSTSLFKKGNGFLLLSILTTVGLSMDSFIVAKTNTLEEVSIYSIATRATQMISVACSMISMPLWAANGEALARGDYDWVRKNTAKMVKISFHITLFSSALMVLFAKPLFNIWLGAEYTAPLLLLAGLLSMQIILSVVAPYFMVLNGAGVIRSQVYIFMIFTPVTLTVKYIAASYYNMYAVPIVGALCYAILVIPPVFFLARKVFHSNKLNNNYSQGK